MASANVKESSYLKHIGIYSFYAGSLKSMSQMENAIWKNWKNSNNLGGFGWEKKSKFCATIFQVLRESIHKRI